MSDLTLSLPSYYMINGGNIIALQKVLGHQSLTMTMTMTMRHAHLSPEHLQETRNLHPISAIYQNE